MLMMVTWVLLAGVGVGMHNEPPEGNPPSLDWRQPQLVTNLNWYLKTQRPTNTEVFNVRNALQQILPNYNWKEYFKSSQRDPEDRRRMPQKEIRKPQRTRASTIKLFQQITFRTVDGPTRTSPLQIQVYPTRTQSYKFVTNRTDHKNNSINTRSQSPNRRKTTSKRTTTTRGSRSKTRPKFVMQNLTLINWESISVVTKSVDYFSTAKANKIQPLAVFHADPNNYNDDSDQSYESSTYSIDSKNFWSKNRKQMDLIENSETTIENIKLTPTLTNWVSMSVTQNDDRDYVDVDIVDDNDVGSSLNVTEPSIMIPLANFHADHSNKSDEISNNSDELGNNNDESGNKSDEVNIVIRASDTTTRGRNVTRLYVNRKQSTTTLPGQKKIKRKKSTTTPPRLDIPALMDIIENLTQGWSGDLLQMLNKSMQQYSVPTCPTPTTTEITTSDYSTSKYENLTGILMGKCYVCGLTDKEMPFHAYCKDAFASDFIPLVKVDPTAKGKIAKYKKYCRWKNVQGYQMGKNDSGVIHGRWTGGCSVRWIDISGIYTQRTCRNRHRPTMGKHWASKRMAKLESALQHVDNGCIISPMASLVPLSRGVSLYARFHACVCTGYWCNLAPVSQQWSAYTAVLTFLFNVAPATDTDPVNIDLIARIPRYLEQRHIDSTETMLFMKDILQQVLVKTDHSTSSAESSTDEKLFQYYVEPKVVPAPDFNQLWPKVFGPMPISDRNYEGEQLVPLYWTHSTTTEVSILNNFSFPWSRRFATRTHTTNSTTRTATRTRIPVLRINVASDIEYPYTIISTDKKKDPINSDFIATKALDFFFHIETSTTTISTSNNNEVIMSNTNNNDAPFMIDLLKHPEEPNTEGENASSGPPKFDSLEKFIEYKDKSGTLPRHNQLFWTQFFHVKTGETTTEFDEKLEKDWPFVKQWFSNIFPNATVELLPDSMSEVDSNDDDNILDIVVKPVLTKHSHKLTTTNQEITETFDETIVPTTVDVISQWNNARQQPNATNEVYMDEEVEKGVSILPTDTVTESIEPVIATVNKLYNTTVEFETKSALRDAGDVITNATTLRILLIAIKPTVNQSNENAVYMDAIGDKNGQNKEITPIPDPERNQNLKKISKLLVIKKGDFTVPRETIIIKRHRSRTTPLRLDIPELMNMIENLTAGWSGNLLEMLNQSLMQQSIPTCPHEETDIETETTTTETPDPYANITGIVMAKCFVCGLEEMHMPFSTHCSDAFANEMIPIHTIDHTARKKVASYRKYCRWKNVPGFLMNKTETHTAWGRWTGGCSVRWIDISGMYTQRTCRNKDRPTMGRHWVSKQMAKLELALKHRTDGCIVSPVASLVPLSRAISLYARFHACVCSGNWCNRGSVNQQWTVFITLLTIVVRSILISR